MNSVFDDHLIRFKKDNFIYSNYCLLTPYDTFCILTDSSQILFRQMCTRHLVRFIVGNTNENRHTITFVLSYGYLTNIVVRASSVYKLQRYVSYP